MAFSERRIIALWFPRLATDRLQRRWRKSPPPDGDLPLVLVARVDNAMRVQAVDHKAECLGLVPGMALASARAMMPMLKVVATNQPADAKLLERLADWCDGFSPLVALNPPLGLLLDVTGTAHLFDGEETMLLRLCSSLKRQGFAVAGALAGSAMAAHALARYQPGTIVPPGRDQDAVRNLPVEALGLDPAITHALRRAGLKKVEQAVSRKRTELTARFGAAMVACLDGVLGKSETPISPRRSLPPYRVERRFADPVVTEEILLTTVTSLAGHLERVMAERGEGARAVEAIFFRADGVVRRVTVEMGAPTRDPSILQRLFREKIASLADPFDPGFGYDLIRLEVTRSQAYREEATGFASNAAEEKELQHLVDRLAVRFGSHRVLTFRPNDTHIPERAFSLVHAQHAAGQKSVWEMKRRNGEVPRRPFRFFSPEPVSMLSGERFRWRNAIHKISKIEGPERIAMQWWCAPGASRDYYRVEDEEGRRYWLYKEVGARWFLHGAFA